MSRSVAKAHVTKIAGYHILGKLKVGRHCVVYKGRDPHTDALVAIKVLSENMANDSVLRLRFAQECQVARRIQHPNVVRVMDYGLDGDKPYLIMEFVQGENLTERLQREQRLAEQEAVAIAGQIGKALHAAHQCGLIHRDVTPDNILITADGIAKLTDLGLVKNLDGEFNLTCTQSALGTPNFMAPEQFEDAKRVDALTDLYSLAATLYQMVTGELPFRARSNFAIGAIYKKKLLNDLAPAQQLNPAISERVSAALARALRAVRKERQANVLEFIESLAPPPAVLAVPSPTSAEPRRRRVAAGRERRNSPRFAVQVGACCQPFEARPVARWDATALNICESGFCLELDRKFEKGTVLTVRLEGKKLRLRSLLVRVMWVKKLSTSKWQIGCQYDYPLSAQEVEEFR